MAFQDFYRLSSHAVLTNDAGQVLLLKANYADQAWGLPGGALDMEKPFIRLYCVSAKKSSVVRFG